MDITLVCGRRPDLLALTLASFGEKIIGNFPSGTVYANIDPFCGTEADGDACEALLREHFSDVVITRPGTPSFGAAVKALWQKPTSPYFLHMEDDWDVLHPVSADQVDRRLSDKVAQVQLSSRDSLYLPKTYAYKTTWRSLFGLKLLKRVHQDRPLFGTSPSFIQTKFARSCAQMMDPNKDPEKQLFAEGTNLGEFTRSYRNHPLEGPGKTAIIRDLGREWLAARGVEKKLENGVSSWASISK
jgi:hypothetical protein